MEASTLDYDGTERRFTPVHHYPLPAHLPGRYLPSFNGNNQYRLPDPATGEMRSWMRATSLAKMLDDTFLLNQWRIRKVLIGLTQRLNLQADLEQLGHGLVTGEFDENDARGSLNSLADEAAKAADIDKANEFGTAVHDWAAWVDMELLSVHQVPDLFREHVMESLRLQARYQILPVPEYTERIVLSTRYRMAGTLDRVYLDHSLQRCGGHVLGDVKTSRTLDFARLAHAIQLAFYHSCDLMLSEDGTHWEPLPPMDPDIALIMHLPSDAPGNSDVQPVDLIFGRRALDLALQVREIRHEADKKDPNPFGFGSITGDELMTRWFAARFALQTSTTSAEAAQVWESNQDIWNDALTAAGHATLRALTAHAQGNENAR